LTRLKSAFVTATAGRPEAELLIRCAQARRNSKTSAQIGALLRLGVQWEYLLGMADEHGMMPLLFWHLDDAPLELVPAAVLARLRGGFHRTARRNLFLTAKLIKLLNLLEAHELPAIPYKGPVLAASAYGNLALREFGDLDILVHKRDVPRAKDLLSAAGYQPQYRLTPTQESAFLRYNCEHAFVHEDDGCMVDLHWAITERFFSFPLDPECLWERLHRVPLGGSDVPTFSPEDLLLILCVHGSKNAWERLKYICDVAELIRTHRDMDWRRVVERAGRLGSQRMLFVGLLLARDLLEMPLPDEVSRKAHADPAVEALVRGIGERLFQRIDHSPRRFVEMPFRPIHMKMRERLRDKVRYLVRLAMTHTVGDWMALPLPKPFFFLYYVLRPIRLARNHGRRLFITILRM
jgi:Uncharacterised nucleotidyltransferase